MGPESGGGSGGGGGCFIATAAYGSILEPHVKILRDFRDRFLLTHQTGQFFVRAYYKYSPPVAGFIAENPAVRAITRIALLPAVGISWIFLKLGIFYSLALLVSIAFNFTFIFRLSNRLKR